MKNNRGRFKKGISPWNKGKRGSQIAWNKNPILKVCEICQKNFYVNKFREKIARFCSIKCKGEWQSRYLSGENSYGWRGGISTYERKLWFNRQRRIKKLGNGGFHTQDDWDLLKAQYNWTCPACKKSEPEITLSEDHVIPISKGGSDNIENIQPLCRSCNSRKYNRLEGRLCVQ